MPTTSFPYAVRLLGFAVPEERAISDAFEAEKGKGYGYFILDDGNLQDPDLYLAKGDDLSALRQLAGLTSELRPALLLGEPAVDLPFTWLPRTIDRPGLIAGLDRLVERRAEAMAQLPASDVVLVPERRRNRPNDGGDPSRYEQMRVRRPENGIVVVLDKTAELSDGVRDLLKRRARPVEWARDESAALTLCQQQPVALLLINTSAPGVDPYRLASALRESKHEERTAVVLLASAPFAYNPVRAREVGIEGYLRKPLASRHLASLLMKFVPGLR